MNNVQTELLSKRRPQRQRIVDGLRGMIVSGTLGAGMRLPGREELAERFETGSDAIQFAFSQLAAEGFIVGKRKRGTFVSDRAPHLCQYGVVFLPPVERGSGVSFLQVLSQIAVNPDPETCRRTKMYFGVAGLSGSEDYGRLVDDVMAHRVAGLLFAQSPHELRGTPVLDVPGIPRVVFGLPQPPERGLYAVSVGSDFFDRAVQHLKQAGRSRIACLFLGTSGSRSREDLFKDAVAKHGLTTRPCWVQRTLPIGADCCTHLLMSGRPGEDPDGLIISDDSLVEAATAGLLAAQKSPPKDLDVVAHCNYPGLPRAVTPVRFLGFDVRVMLRLAMDTVDTLRRGESAPPAQTVPAVFEEEFATEVSGAVQDVPPLH